MLLRHAGQVQHALAWPQLHARMRPNRGMHARADDPHAGLLALDGASSAPMQLPFLSMSLLGPDLYSLAEAGALSRDAAGRRRLAAAGLGVLRVRLFRPFSAQHFLAALPKTVKALAVLDRTKEPGAAGEPLYQDVLTVLGEAQQDGALPFARMPRVIGGRYGLSSKEFTPGMVARRTPCTGRRTTSRIEKPAGGFGSGSKGSDRSGSVAAIVARTAATSAGATGSAALPHALRT